MLSIKMLIEIKTFIKNFVKKPHDIFEALQKKVKKFGPTFLFQ